MTKQQADRSVRLPLRSPLTPRLALAASLVRPGAVVADVGTDHAYLPIHLVGEGIACRAIASDIHEGPLQRAEANVRRFGLEDKITLRLTPGLNGIEVLSPTDILICGMGGEMIASILADAPFVRDPAIRLILQPMTSVRELRVWLYENGFSILDEQFAAEKEKLYVVISAVYSGKCSTVSAVDSYAGVGKCHPLYSEWVRRQLLALQKQADGLAVGGRADEALLALIAELRKLSNEIERNLP